MTTSSLEIFSNKEQQKELQENLAMKSQSKVQLKIPRGGLHLITIKQCKNIANRRFRKLSVEKSKD